MPPRIAARKLSGSMRSNATPMTATIATAVMAIDRQLVNELWLSLRSVIVVPSS